MLSLSCAAQEIVQIRNLSNNHPHPFVRKNANVVLLKIYKTPHNKICEIQDVSENTVRSYLKGFVQHGLNFLTEIPFNKPKSKLEQFDEIIREYFKESPPSTIKQACFELKEKIGFEIGEDQLRKYIKAMGIKYRKVGAIPAKADSDVQKEFYDNILQPILEEAKEKKREVYFMDAAHFVFGAFLAYLWSFTRIFVRTPSGIQRFNVLGALNAVTKKVISVKNETYITSIQVCELLRKIRMHTLLPITIILDNAKYQKCLLVQKLAKELNIELLYLPTYSPNLNLIERFWKFVKKNCLNSKYYENFSLFKENIDNFINHAHISHEKELQSLLTLKFQLFKKEQIKDSKILDIGKRKAA